MGKGHIPFPLCQKRYQKQQDIIGKPGNDPPYISVFPYDLSRHKTSDQAGYYINNNDPHRRRPSSEFKLKEQKRQYQKKESITEDVR